MDGRRHTITSANGTRIGVLSAGSGSPLLLAHGGMGQLERWAGRSTRALPSSFRAVAAWQVLQRSRRFEPGQSLVVHSAAGGVGTLAVQLAWPRPAACARSHRRSFQLERAAEAHRALSDRRTVGKVVLTT